MSMWHPSKIALEVQSNENKVLEIVEFSEKHKEIGSQTVD